ncbi:MAG: MMPL family transporter [Spirochaetales bacterium]|nr:MMPL family transporter [Spirochaetales bacterium]
MKLSERFFEGLSHFIFKFHKIIPVFALILLILSFWAADNLEIKTQIKDLLPADNPKVQNYETIIEHFSGGTSVIITVEGRNKGQMIEAAEAFVAEVRNNPDLMKNIRAINLKMDKEFMEKWGFLLQKPKDLEKTGKILSLLNLLPFIRSLNDMFEETYTGSDAEEELETRKQENEAVAMLSQMESFFTLLRGCIEKTGQDDFEGTGKAMAETFLYGEPYGFSWDDSMLMFTISPAFDAVDMDKIMEFMPGIKRIHEKIQASFPDLVIGYTGDVPIQADEQDAMSFDMVIPSLLAVVLILVLFLFSFYPIRTIVFSIVTLICGIIFTYGFVGITIREINMLTSIMAVLLIGMGIDYGIQIITNYNGFRQEGMDREEALKNTFVKAGMGTLLAAFTTAVGFFVMAATGSRAFAQFGIVMGFGIIICYISMVFILSSLLILFGKKNVTKRFIPQIRYNSLGRFSNFFSRHKPAVFIGAVLVTAGLLGAAFLNSMEYDVMKLEPQEMPSIIGYHKIIEKYGLTIISANVVTDSVEEARGLTAQLEKDRAVIEVNSISSLIPPADEQDRSLGILSRIRTMSRRYEAYDYSTDDVRELADEIQRLEWNIIEIGDLSVAGLGEKNKIVLKRNAMIHEVLGAETGKPGREVFRKLITLLNGDPAAYKNAITELDNSFAREMDAIVSKMAKVNRRITVNDLPESIADNFFDRERKHNLVSAYFKSSVMEKEDEMRNFNERLEKISPKISGSVQILLTWQDEVTSASWKAALYIFLVVSLSIFISFRKITYSLFALIPLVLGMVWMLGLYPLFGLKLNMINVALIPLIIGMGIDFGIHIVHRFMTEGDLGRTYRFTGKAVLLCALTTMFGFGSLAFMGKFGSLVSMGMILFLGIFMCLLVTFTVLPALLGLIKSRRNKVTRLD